MFLSEQQPRQACASMTNKSGKNQMGLAKTGELLQVFTAVSGAGNGSGLLLILTELTGLYAISTILLIRKQLPLKYR